MLSHNLPKLSDGCCDLVCVQGGADWKGPAGSAVAVWEPDGAGGGEEVRSGEQCQTDRGQVGSVWATSTTNSQ